MKILKLKIIKYCVFILPFLIVSGEKDFVDTSSLPQQGSSLQQINSSQQVNPPQESQNKMLDVATGKAEVNTVKINENVIVLDETANRQMISYTEERIEFLSHESVNDIEVGDVLNSAPSTLAKYGVLVKVVNKVVTNGKIILQVEPADIDDLFEEADFSFNTEKGLTLSQSAKTDFGFDLNIAGELIKGGDVSASKVSAQITGKLDFSFDFKTKKIFDHSDNYLRTRMNIRLYKDNDNPDMVLTLSKSFEAFFIEDRLLGVISVPVGPAVIPFSINTDVGAEIKFDFATSPGTIGIDLHGNIGFERITEGGVEKITGPPGSNNWNTMGTSFKLDLNLNQLANFSTRLVFPKIELRVTPFKRASDILKVTPLSIFGGVYIDGELGYKISRGCLTYSDPVLGFEGGIKGNWKKLEYQISASKEYDLGNITWDLWCDNGTGSATYVNNLSSFDISEHITQEAQPSFTIENSSGLHMAEGLNGKEVVFKSMKGRNSNTEDHNLLYSTSLSDESGRYLTIESAPDGNYYNSNYKVLGTSPHATGDVVFKLHATDHGRYLIEGANGKFADLLVGVNNPNSHQKFIEFYRTYNEAKTKDDCKFQILLHPHRPGHYFIYKKDKGYLTPKGDKPARLKLVTRSQEQEFIMMDAENVQITPDIDVFDLSNTENQGVLMQAYGFGGDQSNNYLKYDKGYKLVTGNSASADHFTIYKNNDGTQSILGSNGKYLDIYSSGGFIALFNSTDRYCGDCKFSIEKVSGTQDWFNIRHPKTNKVLSYRGGGGLKFISGNAGWNERFRIVM